MAQVVLVSELPVARGGRGPHPSRGLATHLPWEALCQLAKARVLGSDLLKVLGGYLSTHAV